MTAVYRGARSGSPEPALTGYWAHSCSHLAYTALQSTTLGLHPVIHVPNNMDHYSFTDPNHSLHVMDELIYAEHFV